MRIMIRQPLPSSYYLAIARWKRGHQIFHTQLITINTVIEECIFAIAASDQPKLICFLHHLCKLYDAATACMKYTADFDRELYEKVVRPSMMPPFLSPGFSGTLNKEHNAMVASIRSLAQTLVGRYGKRKDIWPVEVANAWQALCEAQVRNRKNHMLICQKFVDNGVSLLQNFYTNNAEIK